MKIVQSEIPFNYKTIKITKSRIDKGLLAIPISIIDYFPKEKGEIYVFFGARNRALTRSFTPYKSTSRECRIGGMKRFFERNNVNDGDELVIQFLDENTYGIFTEDQFKQNIRVLENAFDKSESENAASHKITSISQTTNLSPENVILSEYYRLSQKELPKRKCAQACAAKRRESVAPPIRKLLKEIYGGKCQVTGFGFLMKNSKPYFEAHHIKPHIGDHFKNLLVVCPNVHVQFTHARVEETFDQKGWLRKVKFNETKYSIFHIVDKISQFKKEVHS